jgi:hypothetical protein
LLILSSVAPRFLIFSLILGTTVFSQFLAISRESILNLQYMVWVLCSSVCYPIVSSWLIASMSC